jgi:hypothetical protein
VSRIAAVTLDRLARDGVQPARADVVAERTPRFGHVVFRRRRQRVKARILLQPLVVLGQHAIDLRLLEHDFRDEDVVRIARAAPRKIAAVSPIPLEQAASKPLSRQRRRRREPWAWGS